MRTDKQIVLNLRKSGKSYNEIRSKLKISKSTLSEWLKPYKWSREIATSLNKKYQSQNRIRIVYLNKIRGIHLEKVYKEARVEAAAEFNNLKYHPLFIAGIVAYWGEGDKLSRNNVRLANTDSIMIKLFFTFLIHVCQIPKEKIKAWILIYPDLNGDDCRNFWSTNTGIPLGNFTKNITIQGRQKIRHLHHGVCYIGVSSRYFKQKMLVWLEMLPKQLLNRSYYR